MTPFVAKPGETIEGLGLDFDTRLTEGETISSVAAVVTSGTGLSITGTGYSGTIAVAVVAVPDNQPDGDHVILYTVTGTNGSVRKASRTVWVRAASE
jgi:hypothetical protein